MATQILAVLVFVAVFAIGAVRGVHIGILMIAGASGTALLLSDMTLDDVVAGFPLSLMVLLTGVTYFFAIAQSNGTVDTLIDKALAKVGSNAVLLPLVFFVITGGIAAMGAPLAGLVMMPVGMQVARRYNVDFALMGLAICFAIGAGGFAPTSLYGIVTYGTAHDAGIALNPFVLWGITIATYLLMLIGAYLLYGREAFRNRGRTPFHVNPHLAEADAPGNHPFERQTAISRGGASAADIDFGEDDEDAAKFDESTASGSGAGSGDSEDGTMPGALASFGFVQWLTVAFMGVLIASVVVLAALGLDPDIGLICFGLASILTLVDPGTAKSAVGKIDWSTVLLVGGIIMFVGVLQHMGAVDMLGNAAKSIGSPLVAAFVLCMIGGLVSAFASTTGILAALVPLALPLVAEGDLPGWALLAALGVCSAVVDVSPYSTLGATTVATAPEEARQRLVGILIRFGLSMVVVGPILLVGGLVFPAMLAS
ncbi:SLC13 family permease [Brevibacterium litoralis]|uniref:SLC13 family permease n=1 Tax=Brevibacterium litoralis TaxID=3138935 RepID=UPI0032EB7330